MGKASGTSLQQYIVRALFMLMALFFMVIPAYNSTKPDSAQNKSYAFDEGWSVTVRGQQKTNVTLSKYSFKICNKGDQLELVNVFPEEAAEINNPLLNFYSVHSVVDIYIDDDNVYSFGHDRNDKGLILGYGNHYVDLPNDFAGKKITIKLLVTEDSAFGGIPAVMIEDGNSFAVRFLSERRINLIIACFLMLFGIILMLTSIIMLRYYGDFQQTYCIAMFSFLVGLWTICNADLIEFFSNDRLVKVYMEYMSLYMMPVPLIFYFRKKVYEKNNPFFMRMIYWSIAVVDLTFVSTAYVSQFLNIAHFPVFLPYAHMIIIFSVLFILAINLIDMIRKRRQKIREVNSIMIGVVIAGSLILLELLRYNLRKFITGFEGNYYNSTTFFAMLIMVMALLIDYGQSISAVFYKSVQQSILEKMAYMDELTGLANRRKCEDAIEEYTELNIPYSIISFDLNFLKKINDSQGHEMGDRMLKTFSDVLKKVFKEVGTIGRMGGDEFMVILPDKNYSQANELMEELKHEMDLNNLKKDSIHLSTSYGIADTTEVEGDDDPHSVYRLADARMYVNKRATNHGRT